jgi:hypothetical protein
VCNIAHTPHYKTLIFDYFSSRNGYRSTTGLGGSGSMKLAYKRILFDAAFGLIPRSVLAQVQPSAAEAFWMVNVADVPIDWTQRHVVFSEGNSR